MLLSYSFSDGLESSVSSAELLPAVDVVPVVPPPVLYRGAKQSLISCSVGVESLLPSSAFDISSSEASPLNKHYINCWKFSSSSPVSVPAGELESGVLSGLEGASNVDWAKLGSIFPTLVSDIIIAIAKTASIATLL
jgi:hypothetical protein